MLMNTLKKYKWILIGSFIGAGLGFSYYYFVGCVNGTCKISSNPYISTIYGAIMAGLVVSMFDKKTK